MSQELPMHPKDKEHVDSVYIYMQIKAKEKKN